MCPPQLCSTFITSVVRWCLTTIQCCGSLDSVWLASSLLTCDLPSLTHGQLVPWSTFQEGALHAPLWLGQLKSGLSATASSYNSACPVEVWFLVQELSNQALAVVRGQSNSICGLGTWILYILYLQWCPRFRCPNFLERKRILMLMAASSWELRCIGHRTIWFLVLKHLFAVPQQIVVIFVLICLDPSYCSCVFYPICWSYNSFITENSARTTTLHSQSKFGLTHCADIMIMECNTAFEWVCNTLAFI